MKKCKAIGCDGEATHGYDFCHECEVHSLNTGALLETKTYKTAINIEAANQPFSSDSMSTKYPQYYKDVRGMSELDVYGVHQLFKIEDSSGAIQHASKKLLLSGVRTGGKSFYEDIKEARDTLTRWLQLNSKAE